MLLLSLLEFKTKATDFAQSTTTGHTRRRFEASSKKQAGARRLMIRVAGLPPTSEIREMHCQQTWKAPSAPLVAARGSTYANTILPKANLVDEARNMHDAFSADERLVRASKGETLVFTRHGNIDSPPTRL